MIKLCFQIWAVANLFILAVFSLALVPGVGLTAFMFSAVFSFPALFILLGLLKLLRRVKCHHLCSWIVLLSGAALCCFAAYYLFTISFPNVKSEFNYLLPLSFICGFSAIVLYSAKLHYLFIKFQYESES